MAPTDAYAKKPFVSSIPLWMRTDRPRQTGMDYWKGPHSKIISATPGFEEYRQIHLAEHNPGLWPATRGVETSIPDDRRIDGVAEVTFRLILSPLLGRKQTKLAFQDEVNVFRRTLLYAGPPNSARWYDVAGSGEKAGARALIYLRRRDGVHTGVFRKDVNELARALAGTACCGNCGPRSSCPGTRSSGAHRTSRTTTPPTSGSTPPFSWASRILRRGHSSSRIPSSRACRTCWLGLPPPSMRTTSPTH
ncbi:hypothetical protein OG809_30710 [Kribbella soli]